MTFRIPLSKVSKAQPGVNAKADDAMTDVSDEGSKGVFQGMDREHDSLEDMSVPIGAKRHFSNRPRSTKSGPGTLAPEPAMGYFPRVGGPGHFATQPPRFGGTGQQVTADPKPSPEENVYATVIAKASNLPPSLDTHHIEELFTDFPALKVVKVEKIADDTPKDLRRKQRQSGSMKITFDKSVRSQDLDEALNKLGNKKYLGEGYYLHLDRYWGKPGLNANRQDEPFAATLHNVHGFAPPPELGGEDKGRPRYQAEPAKRMYVTAYAPPDAPTLRLIHRTIEGVIEGGEEFEAALMQDPQVQEEERFAWLFDQKHPLNRYYRWRLYQIVNGGTTETHVFFQQPEWKVSEEKFVDEFASEFGDLPPWNRDANDDDTPRTRRPIAHVDPYPGRADTTYGILPPYPKAMLMFLLGSYQGYLMDNQDIATISDFVCRNASNGLDEVVEILITNVFQPFSLTAANTKGRTDATPTQRLYNALNIISDVLMVSTREPGDCYKYRAVIGKQLVERKVFEYLETLPVRWSMGRLSANTFRNFVNGILHVWQEERMFDQDIMAHLDSAFNAKQLEREQMQAAKKAEEKAAKKRKLMKEAAEAASTGVQGKGQSSVGVDGAMDEDEEDPVQDGVDEESAGEGAEGEEEGEDEEEEEEGGEEDVEETRAAGAAGGQDAEMGDVPGETAAARARRLRPKAEDMFGVEGE